MIAMDVEVDIIARGAEVTKVVSCRHLCRNTYEKMSREECYHSRKKLISWSSSSIIKFQHFG